VSLDWGFDRMIDFQFMLSSDEKSMKADFDVEAMIAFSHIAAISKVRFPK
jgi:hypothetical protein